MNIERRIAALRREIKLRELELARIEELCRTVTPPL
jgi:hypothetical protein